MLPQNANRFIPKRLNRFVSDRLPIYLEEQIGTTLQIEPEHDAAPRQRRPTRDNTGRHEIQAGKEATSKHREQNRNCFPFGKMEHQRFNLVWIDALGLRPGSIALK